MIEQRGATIKVLGLGGGGSNAVERMIQLGLSGVDFIAANTDAQALLRCSAPLKVQLGPHSTRGLGAGGVPEVGERAAQESRDEIVRALAGADMVFLTAGMGGGTGTGAIPVAAEVSRSLGVVTIAVVTTPFSFEGNRRVAASQCGIERLRRNADTVIVVPNDRLLEIVPRSVSFEVAFHVADDVLRQGVQGIAELIMRPGLINVDFAHVRALMQLAGGAFLAIGHGHGPNKALDAAQQALHHPLLDLNALDQAAGVLAHFTGGDDLALYEVSQAIGVITEAANPEAEIVFGATIDSTFNRQAQVILIATGVGGQPLNDIVIGASEVVLQETRRKAQGGADERHGATRMIERAMAESRLPIHTERHEIGEPAYLRRRALLRQRN